MADLYNNAIEASPLYRKFCSDGVTAKPFLYFFEACPGGFAKHNHAQAPQIAINGSGSGQIVEFRIPRYGLSSIHYLHVVATPSAQTVFGAKGILPLIKDSIQLICGANMLETLYMDYIYYRIVGSEYNMMTNYLNNIGANATVTAIDYYIPLFFSFSERPENFLDVGFTQELTVRFEIGALSNCTASGTSLTALDIKLEVLSTIPEPIEYSKLKDEQFKGKGPSSFLWHDNYKEAVVSAVAGASGVVFDSILLKANKLCSHTIVEVRPAGATNKYVNSQLISKCVLSSMNAELLSSSSVKTACLEKRPWNNFQLAANANAVILRYDLSGSYIHPESGLALRNLNSPMLRVEASGTNGVTYELHVIHCYWNIVNISNDGTVTRSLDN